MKYELIESWLSSRVDSNHYDRAEYDDFCKRHPLDIKAKIILVTGSVGVPDVGFYLSSIYTEKGYKVGRFSLAEWNGRRRAIRINKHSIKETAFEALFERYRKDFENSGLTDVEMMAYLAYAWFVENECDLIIAECSLGGSQDPAYYPGTSPVMTIISSIALNKTELLGTTHSEIARDMAWLIRPKTSALIGKIADEPRNVIRDAANRGQSDFYEVDDYHSGHYVAPHFRFDYRPYKNLAILSPASYLLPFAALAVEATNHLSPIFPIDEFALRKGLETAPLPCRYEKRGNIVLDYADNPTSMQTLAKSISSQSIGRKTHVLFGADRHANIALMLPVLDNVVTDITLTTYPDPLAKEEMDYFLFEADHPYSDDPLMALQNLLALYPDDIVIITGNAHFVYFMREKIKDALEG